MMARVFISHTDADRDLADEVLGWLVDDGHQAYLDHDVRAGVGVGELWEQRLHDRLRWADAVVCVVSAAYVQSPWCAAEVGIASARGSRLLPLHAEPEVTHPLLTAVQYTDLRDRSGARHRLREALARLDAAGGLGWVDGRSPYPGLRPFDSDLHRVFFGRAAEVQELVGWLRSPAARAEAGVLIVVGPSGCGKSSLVRAGVLPVMADEPGWWTVAPVIPGADPVAALARELTGTGRRLGLNWTLPRIRRRLAGDDQAGGGLVELAQELLLAAPGGWDRRRLLVVLDQSEELLSLTPADERARLARLLAPALAGLVQVVATVRPEFLAPLLAAPELAGLPMRPFALRPLRRAMLPAVIEQPAELAGIEVDAELVARLVADTDTGEALPLLAFTLEQLAVGIDRGGHLSLARYQELGGVHGALIQQADAALADAVVTGGRTEPQVITGLLRLVTVDEQGRPTRWRVHRDELPEPVRAEFSAFIARRLLSTDTDDEAVVVEVAHEAFLSAWPPLAAAITAASTALRTRRAVEHAAAAWDAAGRPRSRLWERGQLAAAVNDLGAPLEPTDPPLLARRGAGTGLPPPVPHLTHGLARRLPFWAQKVDTNTVQLSHRGVAFLRASIRTDRRRRARATTILSALLVLAVTAAGVAFNQQQAAQQQQRIAISRQLVAQADGTRDSDPRTALLLGIAAQQIHPSAETQVSLVNTLTATRYAGTLTGHTDAVNAVGFDRGGDILATGSDDTTAALWDVSDPAGPRRLGQPLTGYTDNVREVRFSPDGRILATGGDNTLILWDVSDPNTPRPVGRPLTRYTFGIAFTPDGHVMATGSLNDTVTLWDVSDPALPRRLGQPLTGHTSGIRDVRFSPDGRILATASGDDSVILWNMLDPAAPRRFAQPLTTHSGSVTAVTFSRDGNTLATAGLDSTVILWDVSDPAAPRRLGRPLAGHTDVVSAIAFSPVDAHILATGSDDDTAALWDFSDPAVPRRLGQALTGHSGSVTAVTFSPDGRTLATASRDKAVILWDVFDPAAPRRLGQPMTGHTEVVSAVAFSPLNGHIVATGSHDSTVILWDLSDPAAPRRLGQPLTGHTGSVTALAFSPHGRILATASLDSTVILWDVSDPAAPRRLGQPLTGHTEVVRDVAFSPDGHTLATASLDSTVILWDVSDPAAPRRLGQPLTGHTKGLLAGVLAMAFSPVGHTLATGGSDDTVILWDVSDPAAPRRLGQPLTDHTGSVIALAFSPDGRILATASSDDTVILWDVSDPAAPSLLGQPLTGHTEVVSAVAFSPDGHLLATGSEDSTVILWDVSDPAAPRRLGEPLTGHDHWVSAVAFSPDGRFLITGSWDASALVWDLAGLNEERNAPTRHACSITRGVNRTDWERYIPDLAYEATCR
jgi:WD40 repeat protein